VSTKNPLPQNLHLLACTDWDDEIHNIKIKLNAANKIIITTPFIMVPPINNQPHITSRSNKNERYRQVLVSFMSFKNNTQYPRDRVFTRDELVSITPDDICKYFKQRAYGTWEDINLDTSLPLYARANALSFWKKSISNFMPNRIMYWNELASVGNPTRSAAVNDIIKAVIRKEAARLGKRPQSGRSLYDPEFEQAVTKMEKVRDKELACFLSCFFRFQYNMIARPDDTSKFRSPDLKQLHQYPNYGVIARLCWSKNVMDESDAPDQILLGAMDRLYCVLLGLGLWLEIHYMKNPEWNQYIFGIHGIGASLNDQDNLVEEETNKIKSKASGYLRNILNEPDFIRVDTKKISVYSIRKFAATVARKNGMSKDDIDHRGRWKNKKRQQDVYTDPTIPYVDAKCAASLCKGGPITYVCDRSSGISDDWLLQYAVPHIAARHDRQVAIVLGKAVLWQIFDSSGDEFVPEEIRHRVLVAYNALKNSGRCTLQDGVNPISKRPIFITGVDAELIIEEEARGDVIDNDHGNDDGADANDRRVRRRIEGEQVRLLSSQIVRLQRDINDLSIQLARRDEILSHNTMTINRNLARLSRAPGRHFVQAQGDGQQNNGNNAPVVQDLVASLSARPKTLHDLWNEYEFGAPGKKAAKDFTPGERGKVKYVYYKRNFVWKKVSELVRSGMTAQTACDAIYNVYGQNKTVTQIIGLLQRDSATGGHRNLRIQRL